MNNPFLLASKMSVRFQSNSGSLTTEQLWRIDLTSLDTIALSLKKEIEEAQGKGSESFLSTSKEVPLKLQVKFEVAKSIIKYRLEENQARQLDAEKRAQREFIEGLIQEKKVEETKNLSIAELEAQLRNI